jgi:serine/threonine protein kinase
MGATLYEAVTLAPPVPIPDSLPWTSWTSYLATTEPDPPRRLRPEIPEGLEAIILRCLAHEPAQRYPSAATLASDLESILARASGNDASSRPPPARQKRVPHRAHSSPLSPRKHAALAESSPCWLPQPAVVSHPDIDAWKLPIAAE